MISGRHRLFSLKDRLSEGWPLSEKDRGKRRSCPEVSAQISISGLMFTCRLFVSLPA